MNAEQAVAELRKLAESKDTETAHARADEILCELLLSLGHEDVVDAWYDVPRWYA